MQYIGPAAAYQAGARVTGAPQNETSSLCGFIQAAAVKYLPFSYSLVLYLQLIFSLLCLRIFTARRICIARTLPSQDVRLSVCSSVTRLSTPLNIS